MIFVDLVDKLTQWLALFLGYAFEPPLHGFVNPCRNAFFIGGPLAWHTHTITTVLVTVNRKNQKSSEKEAAGVRLHFVAYC